MSGTPAHTILQLFPELTDVNGDAQNALVLAKRAAWGGVDAVVVPLAVGSPAPRVAPRAIVLGSGVDASLEPTRRALVELRNQLVAWLAGGVPMLAVGTGMELLGRRIQVDGDDPIEGLGLLPGDTLPLAIRVADDLVVQTEEHGVLVGYENHARGFKLDPGVTPLGTVVRGVGDGRGVDGVQHGSITGTRMHGPVLARNPALADALLRRAFGPETRVADPIAVAADAAAGRIRDQLLATGGRA